MQPYFVLHDLPVHEIKWAGWSLRELAGSHDISKILKIHHIYQYFSIFQNTWL